MSQCEQDSAEETELCEATNASLEKTTDLESYLLRKERDSYLKQVQQLRLEIERLKKLKNGN